MARSVILVNNSAGDWTIDRLGGLIVPAGDILDITSIVSDAELANAIQKGLSAEFDSNHFLRIGGVDKTSAESSEFLTPGQAGGSAILLADGAINDTQHGSRGAGTLHPAATVSVPGFMSATDKTKLNGIVSGARPAITWSTGDNNGPGAVSGTSSPTILRYSIYAGTNSWTPDTFQILAQTSNAARPVAVDIYDVTNGLLICSITGITGITPTIYSTTTLCALFVSSK